MIRYYHIESHNGIYRTILPPSQSSNWGRILEPAGFIWILQPTLDLSGELDSIVGQQLFGTSELDLKCTIQRVELDVSLPTPDFLLRVDRIFPQRLDFIQSGKHQPRGFRLSNIPEARWSEIMLQNQIRLVYHRPALGEPCLLGSPSQEILKEIVGESSSQADQ